MKPVVLCSKVKPRQRSRDEVGLSYLSKMIQPVFDGRGVCRAALSPEDTKACGMMRLYGCVKITHRPYIDTQGLVS